MSHPYISIRNTASRLNVHENTVRNWVDKGLLRALRLPTGVRRIDVEDVERLERAIFDVPHSFTHQEVTPAPPSVEEAAQDRVTGRITF